VLSTWRQISFNHYTHFIWNRYKQQFPHLIFYLFQTFHTVPIPKEASFNFDFLCQSSLRHFMAPFFYCQPLLEYSGSLVSASSDFTSIPWRRNRWGSQGVACCFSQTRTFLGQALGSGLWVQCSPLTAASLRRHGINVFQLFLLAYHKL